MEGAGYPDGSGGFEDAVALSGPFEVEFVVGFDAATFVPVAFVHAYHAPGYAGDAAVGEQVGRVGPNAVNALVGYAGEHPGGFAEVERGLAVGGSPDGFGGVLVGELHSDGRWLGCVMRGHSGRIVDQNP